MTAPDPSPAADEAQRILAEYQRRQREISSDRYAPWNAAEELARSGRRLLAARCLHDLGAFPQAGQRALEVGCGSGGWMPDLIAWGVAATDLAGIDLDEQRVAEAKRRLPTADLRVGDATDLPWSAGSFSLVIASTVFTSILDPTVRQRLAESIVEALAPGGAAIIYDFRVDNPRNPAVRALTAKEIRQLFPQLQGRARSLTLAPPLARPLAPRLRWLALALETLPPLRSHLLAVLRKPTAPAATTLGETPREQP
ncbi:MAG: class I SAM-dependent methyltransferase [Acidobacteriota bacterium]